LLKGTYTRKNAVRMKYVRRCHSPPAVELGTARKAKKNHTVRSHSEKWSSGELMALT
jgi:hypothetical protein